MFTRLKGAGRVARHCLLQERGSKTSGRKRRSKLPVILSKDIEKLGKEGDQVYVEPGYARNWLIPQILAKYDTGAGHGHRHPKTDSPGPRVKAEDSTARNLAAMSAEQKQLHKIVHRLQVTPLAVKRSVQKDGQLSKSLTAEGIVAAIAKQKSIALDSGLVRLQESIDSLGTFTVPLGITLGNGEQASLKVIVGQQSAIKQVSKKKEAIQATQPSAA